ncbi:SCF ubiquitin ligase complex subunit cdc4 [Lambiella insularis]|nr:SCF ubiquitin ligase complex subunit cdc4 [Lambiella insularis]
MASSHASFAAVSNDTLRVDPSPHTPHALRPPSKTEGRLVSSTNNEAHGEQSTTNIKSGRPGSISTNSTSHEVLGQFSFAPATQTTIVTTTTTTTTSFPPLMLKAPVHLYELDPKLYPLAASPTPSTLKKLKFELGGRPTIFCEAEDASRTFQNLQEQQNQLKDSHGVLRSITSSGAKPELSSSRIPQINTPSSSIHRRQRSSSRGLRSRARTPVSILEAASLADGQSIVKRGQVPTPVESTVEYPELTRQRAGSSRLQICQTSTPLTPSLDTVLARNIEKKDLRRRKNRPNGASEATTPQPLSTHTFKSHPEATQSSSFPTDNEYFQDSSHDVPTTADPEDGSSTTENLYSVQHGASNQASGLGLHAPFSRPRPPILDTTAAQDISLPSPSLSPVTAAANMQTRRSYFEETIAQRNIRPLALSSPPIEGIDDEDMGDANTSLSGLWGLDKFKAQEQSEPLETPPQQSSSLTMMEIPTLLDSFEAMPAEMKTYVMYQLLRRCPKPLLHFVAETVNPALKCDFLNLLPLELCQNIIGNLDVRSLSRAAQVSRKWRQVVDTDEKSWKKLLDSEGFVMPAGELERAILEGWGWQNSSRGEHADKDISEPGVTVSHESWSTRSLRADSMSTGSSPSDQQIQNAQIKRPKRKAAGRTKINSRKLQKRKGTPSAAVAHFDYDALMSHISLADGPYAAATAAAIAVPNGGYGLPSLRHLHLYKSIYRRHHLIRSNWMQDEIKPRHLAFKAHQRHVVTCLQFDTDKIITGSDDTNVNVYDTKTGAIRARLEGHEGGVWALQYEGNVLVSGSTDRSVRVWDIKKGVCTHVFQGHTSTVRCLVILLPTVIDTTPDGRNITMPKEPLIITGSRDSNLRVWKLPKDGDPYFMQAGPSQDESDCPYFVRALTGHHHSVRAIAAHGDTLVSGSYDCTVRVWRISTGETVHRLQGHAQKVYSVVLDHERNRCISGSMDTQVKVWSLDTGSVLYNLEGHSSLVGLLDLQRNHLVSAAADSTLRVWNPETGHCRSTLSAHTGAITCFQHDGQKVISGSDRTLKMWNVKTGELVRDLLTDLSGVWQVKFDERRCVAAVQRNNLTYIEVLDFGAPLDGIPRSKRGKRIVVDFDGTELNETNEQRENAIDLDGTDD